MAKLLGLFPLLREIVSREGVVHFRRWGLVQTRWGCLYAHQILQSDKDPDPHNHPWAFVSVILRGSYSEAVEPSFGDPVVRRRGPGSTAYFPTRDFHKLTLLSKDVWTLVLTGSRTNEGWGYLTSQGFVENVEYRRQRDLARTGPTA